MSRAKPNAKAPTKKNKFAEIDAIHEKVVFEFFALSADFSSHSNV